MELPFAVESSPVVDPVAPGSHLEQSETSSLVTASSQGSFMNNSNNLDGLNTPQDVVLPRYDNFRQSQQQILSSQPIPQPTTNDGFVEPEVIDFTYVNVCETDADGINILLDGDDSDFDQETQQRCDVLSVLLSGADPLVAETESANEAARKALEAKKRGDLLEALEYHSQAARIYRENAIRNPVFAKSMLLLSQTQAKSALALKGIIKLNPADLHKALPSAEGTADSSGNNQMSHKDRLRAAVRGALGSKHPHEADISDSQFLGSAASTPKPQSSNPSKIDDESKDCSDEGETLLPGASDMNHNPVDEMMELERELRDMDMALELGNSISSLDARMHNRMKNSMVDGSFMVVPPGSNSYMSSSMWGSNNPSTTSRLSAPANNLGTAGVRARANRVQNILDASSAPTNRPFAQPPATIAPTGTKDNTNGLESSWWGASQVLTSSVISLGSRTGFDGGPIGDGTVQPANTKQLMRLMDSLKTLGDENAALLREVEEAEASRNEAKAAREQMKRFKAEYGKRFAALKTALEKFRQDYSKGDKNNNDDDAKSVKNPMNTSEFIRTASFTDQVQRQEQLIRKLTADLKKEKEESKKKDAALRKYESFYREVKARSAQKAKQRELESQQRQSKTHRNYSSQTHR